MMLSRRPMYRLFCFLDCVQLLHRSLEEAEEAVDQSSQSFLPSFSHDK